MELAKLNLTDFLSAAASDAPAPGGGSVSALAGASGAALIAMVAGLTLGREKYAAYASLAREIADKAQALSSALTSAIDRDAAAYFAVSEVFHMPRSTDDEKSARREAMQHALKAAVEPPFEVMALALTTLECAEQLLGRSNTNAASDLGVAALNLRSAIQGAWLNVLVNLAGITDEEFVAEYRARGKAILDRGMALAGRIYDETAGGLEPA